MTVAFPTMYKRQKNPSAHMLNRGILLRGCGVIVDDDVTVTQGRDILNGIAKYVYLDQTVAVSQCVNVGNQVVVHINMGQLLHILQTVQAGQGVIRTVNGCHSAAIRPDRKFFHLVGGERQFFKLCQGVERADVRDGIVGNIQSGQFRVGGQRRYIGKLVVIQIQIA